MKEFWTEYIKANEVDRHIMLLSLPLKKDKDGFYKNITETILQSYLGDLIAVMTGDGLPAFGD
jgi:hypothetical protein